MTNWLRFAVWLLFGLAVYFGFGYVSSNIGLEEQRIRKLNLNLRLASLGFLVSGLGLAGSAFTFVSDFVTYIMPSVSANGVLYAELGLFFVGLAVGIGGVIMQLNAGPDLEAT